MKIAIVGSRDYPRLQDVKDYVSSLPLDTIIVSGGARGVDASAEAAATACGLHTLIFPADWQRFGKQAGYLRNITIVENAELVVAFWDGVSRGTQHTINLAKSKGVPVEIHLLEKHTPQQQA